MLIAAEKPPTNTISPITGCPRCSGSRITNVSAIEWGIPFSSPAIAIGITKILISNMYSGSIHIAVRMCFSSVFSITAM